MRKEAAVLGQVGNVKGLQLTVCFYFVSSPSQARSAAVSECSSPSKDTHDADSGLSVNVRQIARSNTSLLSATYSSGLSDTSGTPTDLFSIMANSITSSSYAQRDLSVRQSSDDESEVLNENSVLEPLADNGRRED